MGGATARELQQELRSRGYRLTPQRQLVLEAVEELRHATPDQVLERVRSKAKGINQSTIYRTLELLESLELVTHTHLGHGAPTYHPASSPDHAHLVCAGCGEVRQVDPDVVAPLVEALKRHCGFTTDVRHLAVQGRCANCSENTEG